MYVWLEIKITTPTKLYGPSNEVQDKMQAGNKVKDNFLVTRSNRLHLTRALKKALRYVSVGLFTKKSIIKNQKQRFVH